jgi:hypothetical protein
LEPRRPTAWREIPVEELRRFMSELVADSNLREAGRLMGRFGGGDSEPPHDRTREAIARLYEQKHGAGVMAAAETRQAAPSATPLKLILPQGVERATTEIRAIFEALRRGTADLPPTASAVETWLLRRVKEEYAAEVPYPRKRQRPPRKKPAE